MNSCISDGEESDNELLHEEDDMDDKIQVETQNQCSFQQNIGDGRLCGRKGLCQTNENTAGKNERERCQ